MYPGCERPFTLQDIYWHDFQLGYTDLKTYIYIHTHASNGNSWNILLEVISVWLATRLPHAISDIVLPFR